MPFLADTDFPWIIVAMIFIAFFRWLSDRIKEAVRGPETMEFEEEPEDFEIESAEPEASRPGPPPLSREPVPSQVSPPQAPPSRRPPPVPASHPGGEFRRLLDTLRSEAQTPPAAVPSPASPPPPPASRPAVSPSPASPAKRGPLAAPRRASALALTPKAIRDGIVLREILGPPVALRNENPRGS